MDFVNHDLLCLCALLRGLLAIHPGSDEGSLPHDVAELQALALQGLCGLTAPELAFPGSGEGEEEDDEAAHGIAERNLALSFYLEVLCAAVVETGLLEGALNATLLRARMATSPAEATQHAASAVHFLSFLAALVLRAEVAERLQPPEPAHPALRLRAEVARRADGLGLVLEAVLAVGLVSSSQTKELTLACATLSAGLGVNDDAGGQEFPEGGDDAFTLACRSLLSLLHDGGLGDAMHRDTAATLVAFAAVAVHVGEWETWSPFVAQAAGRLSAEECQRASFRLSRTDAMRVPVRAVRGIGIAALLPLFRRAAPASAAELPTQPATQVASATPAALAPSPGGLRDVVLHAPAELRCAIDGKLLCDPVISPAGVVFERTTLARCLQARPGRCPVTGQPLDLEQCSRSTELRRKVTDWARHEGRSSKARPPRAN